MPDLAVKARTLKVGTNNLASLTTDALTTASGNLFVVLLTAFTNVIGDSAVTDNKSNTWTPAMASTGATEGWTRVFYSTTRLGGASHTFTFTPSSAAFITITVWEIENAATSSVLGSTNGATGSTANYNSGSITANASVPEVWFGGVALSRQAQGYGVATGSYWAANQFTYTSTSANEGVIASYKIVAPNTSGAFTVTTLAANQGGVVIAAFKAASPASGGGSGASAYAFA